MKKKILFVCRHNRFRSKVAEAFFNKHNKNSDYKAKSAGIIRGRFPLDKYEVSGARKFEIKLKGKPKGLTYELMIWQNITIIVADDVPKSIFKDNKKYGKKTIVWRIKDNENDGKKEISKIIKQIEKKVKLLVKSLK